MNFENIDITDIECFGFSSPKKDCWLTQLRKAQEFSMIQDVKKFEDSFASNIESSYYRLCGVTFKDLDTDLVYYASFVNGWKKWDLEVEDGKAEVPLEEKKTFFKTDEMKKIAARAAKYIEDAAAMYEKSVKEQIEEGNLLKVDESKLEALIKQATDASLLSAFKSLAVSEKTFS